MAYLRVNEVTQGMICSADVSDKNGQLLIPENTCLEEKHLRLIKAWGVSELPILEDGSKDSEKVAPSSTDAELEQRFIHCNALLPVVIEMKRILISGDFLREGI